MQFTLNLKEFFIIKYLIKKLKTRNENKKKNCSYYVIHHKSKRKIDYKLF